MNGWKECDVVIMGVGFAGLSLARHLQLTSEKRVLLVDRNRDIPTHRQKVGESTVQVGGDYYAKVLRLAEGGIHRVGFRDEGRPVAVEADWVVDTQALNRFRHQPEAPMVPVAAGDLP